MRLLIEGVMATRQPSVYVSAASADQNWQRRIAGHLSDANLRVLYGSFVKPDDALDVVRDQASVFVLLVSKSYLESPFIHNAECPHIRSFVISEERPVIYVILEQCPWQNLVLRQVPRVVIPSGGRVLAEEEEEEIKDELHTLTR